MPVQSLVDDPDAIARVARRYPRGGPRRTPVVAAIAVLAAVVVAWTIWSALGHANPPITAEVTGFRTFDDHVAVNLSVQRPDPARGARCLVVAEATNFERVGELWVSVPPSAQARQDVQFDLRTFRRATTARSERCELT